LLHTHKHSTRKLTLTKERGWGSAFYYHVTIKFQSTFCWAAPVPPIRHTVGEFLNDLH